MPKDMPPKREHRSSSVDPLSGPRKRREASNTTDLSLTRETAGLTVNPELQQDSVIRGGMGDRSSWAHRLSTTYKDELAYLREDYQRMKFNVDYDKLVSEVLGSCFQFAKETIPTLLEDERVCSVLSEHTQKYVEAKNEYELYPPFRDFAEALFRFAKLPFHFLDTHLKPRPNDRPDKGNPKRKPDVVMIHQDHTAPGEDTATVDIQQFPWSKVVLPMEFKYSKERMASEELQKDFINKKEKVRKPKKQGTHTESNISYGTSMRSDTANFRTGDQPQMQEQLAAYAIEMFSARGIRRHVLGLYIDSLSVEFWYYDRSSGYGSIPCSFGRDWVSIATLLLAIGKASPEQLGLEPHIMPPRDVESRQEASILIEADKARITVDRMGYEIEGEKLGRLRSLTGRGTAVFKVKSLKADDKHEALNSATDGLVIKLSWQLQDRRSEVEILEHLHTAGVSSVPYVVASQELAKMKHELHGRLQRTVGSDTDADHRIYRAIVMKPFLVHLTTIAEWTIFYDAFKGLIDIHREIYIKANILHRDINPENLMVKMEANDRYVPFLIDFDFAKNVNRDTSDVQIGTHRTMATPFLALELLSDPPPTALYRHDLESFCWCLWWIAVTYLDGKQIKTNELHGWYSGQWKHIRIFKEGSMKRRGVRASRLTENMEYARPILERLAELFRKVFESLGDLETASPEEREAFDQESAGGVITWETFQACLTTD